MRGKTKKKECLTEGNLKDALIKKAFGYDATEIVEEYIASEEGEIKLTKKKVTKKSVPPDMTALKMLIDEKDVSVQSMSDEQLQEEKERLLKLLSN